MGDRELIELAAKAAGMAGGWGEVQINAGQELDMTHMWFLDDDSNCPIWNPLEDDGDALRLAVKLTMDVCVGGSYVYVRDIDCNETYEDGGEDLFTATRLAIVRAAAAIGQSMP